MSRAQARKLMARESESGREGILLDVGAGDGKVTVRTSQRLSGSPLNIPFYDKLRARAVLIYQTLILSRHRCAWSEDRTLRNP